MTATDAPPTATKSGVGRDIWAGLLLGSLLWAAYFVQASTLDAFSWEVTVVPLLALTVVGAVIFGLSRPAVLRRSMGVALGVVLTLPLVLGAFVVIFTVLNLE